MIGETYIRVACLQADKRDSLEKYTQVIEAKSSGNYIWHASQIVM
jgi:hypothetical protein